jgi:hypothetical protein
MRRFSWVETDAVLWQGAPPKVEVCCLFDCCLAYDDKTCILKSPWILDCCADRR